MKMTTEEILKRVQLEELEALGRKNQSNEK